MINNKKTLKLVCFCGFQKTFSENESGLFCVKQAPIPKNLKGEMLERKPKYRCPKCGKLCNALEVSNNQMDIDNKNNNETKEKLNQREIESTINEIKERINAKHGK